MTTTLNIDLKPPIEAELQALGDIVNAIFIHKVKVGDTEFGQLTVGIYLWSENVFMCDGEKFELKDIISWGTYDISLLLAKTDK